MSQPKPTHNQAEPTFEVLKRLIDRKAAAGRLKYGIALQPLNGRCSLVDLLEELVDGSKYALNEIRNQRQLLRQLVGWSNDLAAVDNADAKSVGQDIEEMFIQLGGWPAITMYGELLGDFGRSEMVDVPRQYGMTDQVPPAAASRERRTGVIAAYLREQAGLLRECDKTLDGAVIVQWLLADAERLDWESASSPASPTVANDATVRDQILDDVLALLAGAGIPTPERGYKADGGWGLALSDLKKAFEEVRRLQQANADLRKARESAVEQAKRQHETAKALRAELAAIQQKTFERAIAIARGCQIEYTGGYGDQREIEAFHHGMTTVEICLRARQNPTDYRAERVEQMGLRELKREAEVAKEGSHG